MKAFAEGFRQSCNARPDVERVSAMPKDGRDGRHVRVRDHARVRCRPMFGIPAPAVRHGPESCPQRPGSRKAVSPMPLER